MSKVESKPKTTEGVLTLEELRQKPDIQDVITYFQAQIDGLKKK